MYYLCGTDGEVDIIYVPLPPAGAWIDGFPRPAGYYLQGGGFQASPRRWSEIRDLLQDRDREREGHPYTLTAVGRRRKLAPR